MNMNLEVKDKLQFRGDIDMIKNIIFDLGNVIINYNQERIIKNFTKEKAKHDYIIEHIFKAPEWKMMDLGIIRLIIGCYYWSFII